MKKIVSVMIAVMMVLALSVSAFAIDGTQDLVLVVQDSSSWQTQYSDRVTIDGPGEYTFTLSGLSIDGPTMTVLYIKDADAVETEVAGGTYEGAATISGATILTKSVKINGEEVSLTEGYPTGVGESGLVDICWLNIWASSYMDLPSGIVTDIEVVLEVVDADAAEAPTETAETETTESSAAVVTEDPATGETETTPVAEAPSTGIALAVIPAIMALGAVCVSKKR